MTEKPKEQQKFYTETEYKYAGPAVSTLHLNYYRNLTLNFGKIFKLQIG